MKIFNSIQSSVESVFFNGKKMCSDNSSYLADFFKSFEPFFRVIRSPGNVTIKYKLRDFDDPSNNQELK